MLSCPVDGATVTVSGIDPHTGQTTGTVTLSRALIGHDPLVVATACDNGLGSSPAMAELGHMESFAPDWGRVAAVTATTDGTGRHVGWIDAQGKFTDVSALDASTAYAAAPLTDDSPMFSPTDGSFWFTRSDGHITNFMRQAQPGQRPTVVSPISLATGRMPSWIFDPATGVALEVSEHDNADEIPSPIGANLDCWSYTPVGGTTVLHINTVQGSTVRQIGSPDTGGTYDLIGWANPHTAMAVDWATSEVDLLTLSGNYTKATAQQMLPATPPPPIASGLALSPDGTQFAVQARAEGNTTALWVGPVTPHATPTRLPTQISAGAPGSTNQLIGWR